MQKNSEQIGKKKNIFHFANIKNENVLLLVENIKYLHKFDILHKSSFNINYYFKV